MVLSGHGRPRSIAPMLTNTRGAAPADAIRVTVAVPRGGAAQIRIVEAVSIHGRRSHSFGVRSHLGVVWLRRYGRYR